MADTTFKQLTEIIQPLQNQLGQISERLDKMDQRLDKVDQRLDKVDQRLDKVDQDLAQIKRVQQNHSQSLVVIETTVNGYADMYKINNDNAKRLDMRTKVLEKKLSVDVPPELALVELPR